MPDIGSSIESSEHEIASEHDSDSSTAKHPDKQHHAESEESPKPHSISVEQETKPQSEIQSISAENSPSEIIDFMDIKDSDSSADSDIDSTAASDDASGDVQIGKRARTKTGFLRFKKLDKDLKIGSKKKNHRRSLNNNVEKKERNTESMHKTKDIFDYNDFGKFLKDKVKRTEMIYDGKRIYQVISRTNNINLDTGDYFYIDGLEGSHFEVFFFF